MKTVSILLLCASMAGCTLFQPTPKPAAVTALGVDEVQRLRSAKGYTAALDASTDWVVDAMSTIRRLQTQRDSRP